MGPFVLFRPGFPTFPNRPISAVLDVRRRGLRLSAPRRAGTLEAYTLVAPYGFQFSRVLLECMLSDKHKSPPNTSALFPDGLSVVDSWARAAMRIAGLLVGPAGFSGFRGDH